MSRFLLGKYSTKEDVYHIVLCLRKQLGLPDYSLDSKEIVQEFCKNPLIEYMDFDTSDICGILYKGDNSTEIALNASRSSSQQNFDCAHELIHYFCHPIPHFKCICSEKNVIQQERSMEYQANEGAAQLLIPYDHFIPEAADLYEASLSSYDIDCTVMELSKKYKVSDSVIYVRLQSLKYEIAQYMSGVPLNNIRILSDSRQKQEGINVRSVKDIRDQKCHDECLEMFKLAPWEANIYAV